MADVINLNRVRKARMRTEDAKQAEVNRVRFGRSKEEKRREKDDRQRPSDALDGKKIE